MIFLMEMLFPISTIARYLFILTIILAIPELRLRPVTLNCKVPLSLLFLYAFNQS